MTVHETETAAGRDADELLRALKRRIFADGSANVPRLFLKVVERSVPPTAFAVGRTSLDQARHSVFWLHGSSLGALSCSGSNDDSDVQIEGPVWPMSELSLAKLTVEPLEYDPITRQVTRWTRRVTHKLGGEELHFDAVDTLQDGTDRVGDFIDTVLHAMTRHPPSRS